jgi:hypothetical protein
MDVVPGKTAHHSNQIRKFEFISKSKAALGINKLLVHL